MTQTLEDLDHRFAWLFEADASAHHCPWDTVVMRDAAGASVPSRGSIVPGWLLTFPSVPAINLAELPAEARTALLRHANAVGEKVASFAKRLFQFEHGAGAVGSLTGCGLDVAHLHTVPLDFDLIGECRSQLSDDIDWLAEYDQGDAWARLTKGEYVVIREPAKQRAIVGRPKQPTSQLVRRVIARATRHPDRWDYRAHDGAENVSKTLTVFAREGV